MGGRGHAHALQCPEAETSCPTCGQFEALRSAVDSVRREYDDAIRRLAERLAEAEDRISGLEECDCPRSCRAEGGVVREDGATWDEGGCKICSCVVSRVFGSICVK